MPKKLEDCVAKLLADPKFKPMKGKTKKESAYAVCNASIKESIVPASGILPKECMLCEIEDMVLFQEALEEIIKNMEIIKNTDQFIENITASLTLEKFEITDEELNKVNKHTIKPVKKEDIIIYPAMLIDDQITRNNTQYPKEFQNTILALPVGEGNFIGSPVLFGKGDDHQETASAQVGRIYEAYQVIDKEKHYGVLGKMYILKEENEDLITKIDAGIIKEVSIAAKVEFPMCSICKQNIQTCEHTRGKDGCYVIMSGNGFCGEVSFVAVPGSDQAKILKNEDLSNYVKLEANLELLKEFIKTEMHTSIDAMKAEFISVNEELSNYIKENITAKDPKGTMSAGTGSIINNQGVTRVITNTNIPSPDSISHQINLYEKYNEIVPKIEKAKVYIIKYTAKYSLPVIMFNSETLPKIEQGMTGIDEDFISKICYDNIDILNKALTLIESSLRFDYGNKVSEYAGDMKNNIELVKYMSIKIENILERIYMLQGRFNLEDMEKNNIINETIRLGTIIDKIEIKDKETAKKFFQNLSTEEISRIKDMFFKEGTFIFRTKIEIPKDEVKSIIDDDKDLRKLSKKILNKEDKVNV